ncbi:MAG TPA: Smr/MutS family protein [Acetobacteraceae bacterium]|jgi:DNA-nicking Smr family endonuclease
MSRRPRNLTDADRAQWAEYASAIRPLRERGEVPAVAREPSDVPPVPATVPVRRVATKAPPPAPLTVGDPPGGVDRATWERFRSGRLPSVRTLDLHGHTAQQAYHALTRFLHAAHAEQVRCVEVVTGRGSRGEGGVIRREFALWLNLPEIRSLVLAAAHPHAANPGAVRLLLRRVR